MWRKNANGDNVKPEVIDRDSSRKYVYIRKDFVLVEATEDIPEHWEWMEAKIPKDALTIWDQTTAHEEALDDVYAALTELAEIIAGE